MSNAPKPFRTNARFIFSCLFYLKLKVKCKNCTKHRLFCGFTCKGTLRLILDWRPSRWNSLCTAQTVAPLFLTSHRTRYEVTFYLLYVLVCFWLNHACGSLFLELFIHQRASNWDDGVSYRVRTSSAPLGTSRSFLQDVLCSFNAAAHIHSCRLEDVHRQVILLAALRELTELEKQLNTKKCCSLLCFFK